VVQYVLFLLRLCPHWASHLFFHFAFAHVGQAIYFFNSPLPTLGKPFIFSFRICPRRASRLFFHFAFAHVGQAVYFFILPLPTSGKPFVFSFRPCPRWAGLFLMSEGFCEFFFNALAVVIL